MKTKSIPGMNSTYVTATDDSHNTLWFGLIGAIVVIAGSVLFADAQAQKKETDKVNPIRPVPNDAELRRQLSKEQYRVTREGGTETPFHNAYWDNHRPGIYVNIITSEPLFSSLDKFDSGTGWASFTKPIAPEKKKKKRDSSYGMERTEIRSKTSDCHLGHVFGDGPPPTGERYTVNSAALRFIPVDKLTAEGYGQYCALFQPPQRTNRNLARN